MGEFDRIIKENIASIFLPLVQKFTGIRIIKSTEIKDKIQRTLEREPDFLSRITDQWGKEMILHLEFQSQDDPKMVYRMAEYQALLQRKYEIPVRQLVIHLGTKMSEMRTELTADEQITGFQLLSVRDWSVDQVLDSEIPEEIVISILFDYPESNTDQVITDILTNLQRYSGSEQDL